MSLEVKGKIIKILPEQSGQSKNGGWKKQEFVIETMEQFPKKACFSAWGDKTDMVKQLLQGDEVLVSFNIESREYNERWYTDLRAWKIVKGGTVASQSSTGVPPLSENDIPPEDDNDGGIPF